MRVLYVLQMLLLLAMQAVGQGAPPQGAPDQPYTMEYYYKVQWGHQQEFLQLFLKNHYPLLKKSRRAGALYRSGLKLPPIT